MFELVVKLFIIFNPFGCLKTMDSLLSQFPNNHRRWIVMRELFVAFLLMICTALFGKIVFLHLGIEVSAVQTAGGCVIFLTALTNLFPASNESSLPLLHTERYTFIVPLAIPLMAGPGVLTNILVAADHRAQSQVCLAVTIVSLLSLIIWFCAPNIERRIGKNGIAIIHKFIGLVLIMVAVNMVLTGVREQFSL